MSADATNIKYKCPLCDEGDAFEASKEKDVRHHITQIEEGDHRNTNGFKFEKVIPSYEIDIETGDETEVWNVSSDKPNFNAEGEELDRKLLKATDYFDTIDNDAISEISDAAEVPKSRIFRVLEDNNVDYKWRGRKQAYTWDMLSERQQEILARKLHNTSNHAAIGRSMGKSQGSVNNTLKKYGWMLHELHRPKELDDYFKAEKTVGATEDMIDTYKTSVDDGEEEHDDDKEEERNVPEIENNEAINKLASAGVEFSISINVEDDKFDGMKKLIKAGYDDLAEKVYQDEL